MRFLLDLFGGSPLLYAGVGVAVLVGALLLLKIVEMLLSLLPKARPKTRPRLELVETARIDRRRSVVLIRRDDVEYTVLTGGPQDVILEAALPAPAVRRADRPATGIRTPAMPSAYAPADHPAASAVAVRSVDPAQTVVPLGRLPAGSSPASRRALRGPFQRKA